ncbi:hypothetical protein LP420_27330 [Massilia sp. B-10]|nr:hypothetical protein LP420_27330 [Massilia sp. B-10]
MSCALGKNCYFHDGQATAVKTASATVTNTGLTGQWSVTMLSKSLHFVIDVRGTDLANARRTGYALGRNLPERRHRRRGRRA